MKRAEVKLMERPLVKSDLPQLAEMFFLCFNKKVGLDYFEWKFYENPAGNAIGTVSCDGDQLAGLFCSIPENYIVNGQERIIYQAIDGMVHPNYQGLRIFATLSAINSNSMIEEKGDSYFLGYPGDQSFPVFINKIKWKNPIHIKFQFTNKALFKTRTLFYKKGNFKAVAFNKMDERFDDFFAKKVLSNMPIQKKITPAFLNWRCFSHNTKEFQGVYFENKEGIMGYVIYKMAETNRCFIHLVDALQNSDFVIILQAFCDYIFELKQPSFLFAFEATNPKLKAAFRKNGFIYNPLNKGPFSYRPPLILHSNQEKIQGINFFDAQNWDIQGITRDY